VEVTHLEDIPTNGGLGYRNGHVTAGVSEYDDLGWWIVHHIEEDLTADGHITLHTVIYTVISARALA